MLGCWQRGRRWTRNRQRSTRRTSCISVQTKLSYDASISQSPSCSHADNMPPSHRYLSWRIGRFDCARFQGCGSRRTAASHAGQRRRTNQTVQGKCRSASSAAIGGLGRGGHVWPTEAGHWSAGLPATLHGDWPACSASPAHSLFPSLLIFFYRRSACSAWGMPARSATVKQRLRLPVTPPLGHQRRSTIYLLSKEKKRKSRNRRIAFLPMCQLSPCARMLPCDSPRSLLG